MGREYGEHHVALSVKEMARMLGVSGNGVRFLEDKGVVAPTRNDRNGYRTFSIEDQSVLYMYKMYRDLGIPLDESLDALSASPHDALAIVRRNVERMRRELEEVERKAQRVERLMGKALELPSFSIGTRPELYLLSRSTSNEGFAGHVERFESFEQRNPRYWIEQIPYAFFGVLLMPKGNEPTLTFDSNRCMVIERNDFIEAGLEDSDDAMHLPERTDCLHAMVPHTSSQSDTAIVGQPLKWLRAIGREYSGEPVIARFSYLRKGESGLSYAVEVWIPLARKQCD